jgi:hypothetical protein
MPSMSKERRRAIREAIKAGQDPNQVVPSDEPVRPEELVGDENETDDEEDEVDERAEIVREGFLVALQRCPGQDVHSVHQRLCECVPFLDAAAAAVPPDNLIREALVQFKQFLLGKPDDGDNDQA